MKLSHRRWYRELRPTQGVESLRPHQEHARSFSAAVCRVFHFKTPFPPVFDFGCSSVEGARPTGSVGFNRWLACRVTRDSLNEAAHDRGEGCDSLSRSWAARFAFTRVTGAGAAALGQAPMSRVRSVHRAWQGSALRDQGILRLPRAESKRLGRCAA